MTTNNSDDMIQTQPVLDIEAIEARANAATPGPWHPGADEFAAADEMIRQLGVCLSRGGNTLHLALARRTHEEAARAAAAAGDDVDAGTVFAALVGNGPNSGANAAFIAAARTDVPALVAEVRRLREELDALPEMLRAGVGGTEPPKAAKTDKECHEAIAVTKAAGRYVGHSIYRKEGDEFVFVRHATQAEDDAYIVVYQTGLAAGWRARAERDALRAAVWGHLDA